MAVKPNLALIPSGVKASKVYSVLPSDGVGDFDFSRSGSATRINKDGLIETVASNVPRLNYPLIDSVVSGCPSLLLEPQRINTLSYSEDFSQSYWNSGGTTVSSNNAISPDGTQNADLITEDTSNGFHLVYAGASQVSGRTDTVSVFIKNVNAKYIQITSNNTTTLASKVNFDIELGVIDSELFGTGTIENYGNGWYKLTVSGASGNTGSTGIGFRFLDNLKNEQYTGDGSSSVYLWGFQYEENSSYATSYIPTSGSQTTRSAETCNNSGDANTFNDSEGVLMAEISALDESGGNRELTLSDGSTSNRIIVQYRDSSNIRIILAKSTGDEFDTGVISFDTVSINKIAIKYKTNDFAFWVNGIEIYSDNSGNTFSDNTLSKINFDGGTGGNDFYGNTKQIQYFDTALTDTDLEELTSWQSFNEMAESQLYSIQ